jgi:hypothetical protein
MRKSGWKSLLRTDSMWSNSLTVKLLSWCLSAVEKEDNPDLALTLQPQPHWRLRTSETGDDSTFDFEYILC